MSTVTVLSVRDLKQGTYGRPFFVPNVASGLRSVALEVNTYAEGNMLYFYPQDFEVQELGEFDDVTGRFTLHPVPVAHGLCSGFVDQEHRVLARMQSSSVVDPA